MPTHDPAWPKPYRPLLLRFGQQLLRSQFHGKLDVAGVVQMTLLEAGRQPPPSAHPVACEAWLKAILRNNFQDELRQLTSKKRDVQREMPLGSLDVAAKHESPSRRGVRSEERHRLLMHLGTLPPEQQEALRGRYIEGLSIEALLVRLNKSEAAVKGLLRRGLLALREQFRRESPRRSLAGR